MSQLISGYPAQVTAQSDVRFGAFEKPLKRPFDYFPPQPSKLVMGVIRHVFDVGEGLLNISVDLPETDCKRLESILASDIRTIFTPNHSSPLDMLIFPKMGLDSTYRLGALDIFQAKGFLEKIPGMNRLWAKAVQKNGIFSIVRSGDPASIAKSLDAAIEFLRDGKKLTIFPEGWVTGTHKVAHPPKAGAAYVAMAVAEYGQLVQMVPITIKYGMKGSSKEFRQGLSGMVERLEEALSDRMGRNVAKPGKPLEERVGWLFSRMILERESMYQELYGLTLECRDPDFYLRSENLRVALLVHLENIYGLTGRPEETHEHRARRILGKMSTLRATKKFSAEMIENFDRDTKTLNDIMGLSRYLRDYLKDGDTGALLETLVNLERDIRKMVPKKPRKLLPNAWWLMQKRLRLYRAAGIQASIRVGTPIDINQAMKDVDMADPAQRKALSRRLMEEVRCQIQAKMDEP